MVEVGRADVGSGSWSGSEEMKDMDSDPDRDRSSRVEKEEDREEGGVMMLEYSFDSDMATPRSWDADLDIIDGAKGAIAGRLLDRAINMCKPS